MKKPQFKERSVYGLNANGRTHRAPIEVIQWLNGEIAEAEVIQAQLNKDAKECDYGDYDTEISRHEQDGFVDALRYALAYLENHIN